MSQTQLLLSLKPAPYPRSQPLVSSPPSLLTPASGLTMNPIRSAFKTFLKPATSLPFWTPSWAEPPCDPVRALSPLLSWACQYPPSAHSPPVDTPCPGGLLAASEHLPRVCPSHRGLCISHLPQAPPGPHAKVTFGGAVLISVEHSPPPRSFLISC